MFNAAVPSPPLLANVTVPALVNVGTFTTSFDPFRSSVPPALLAKVPLIFTVLFPPVKPVSNVPVFVTLPVTVTVDPLSQTVYVTNVDDNTVSIFQDQY